MAIIKKYFYILHFSEFFLFFQHPIAVVNSWPYEKAQMEFIVHESDARNLWSSECRKC